MITAGLDIRGRGSKSGRPGGARHGRRDRSRISEMK